MASRRIALIGTNEGPWVDISRIKNPVLRVCKLPSHGKVVVTMKLSDGDSFFVALDANGDHSLPVGSWAQVSVRNCTQHFTVCEILSKKAA